MEIWCDGASPSIVPLSKQGWLKGITTNPKILSKQPEMVKQQLETLLSAQVNYVAVQVTAVTSQGMLLQAKKLHQLSNRLMIKVPFTPAGIEVMPELIALKIPTLATAVFKAEQFLLAATIGVDYVAPYISHMSQAQIDVIEEIKAMQAMIKHYGFKTKVLVASIQDNHWITKMACLGVASITLPLESLLSCCENENSIKSTTRLNEAWSDFANKYAGELFALEE